MYFFLFLIPQVENHLPKKMFLTHTSMELATAQLASVHMIGEHEDILVSLVSELHEIIEWLIEI